MADNTVISVPSGASSGDTIRTLEDSGGVKWPAGVTAYATTVGSPDTLQIVTGAVGLPVKQATDGSPFVVSNAGTFATQVDGDALTALQAIETAVEILDNAIFADDAAFTVGSSSVCAAGFLFDDSTPDTVNEGDVGIGRMSSRREVYTQIRDAAGNERGANVDSLGRLSVAVGSSIALTVQPNQTDGSLTVGDKYVYVVAGYDGSTIRAWSMDASGNGQVDVVGALPAGDNAIGRVKLTDGTDVADVLDLTNANPLTVAIVDGDGTQITSFGGGTQYTEGDTDASITGTAILWEDTSNTLATVSAGSPLPVAIISGAGSGGTASDDDADFSAGTTAGTPAMGVYESSPSSVTDGDMGIVGITQTRAMRVSVENTVTVGLPTGASTAANQTTIIGHLDGVEGLLTTIDADTGNAVTALQIIDDWDESDRCKVNPIAGEAGVAAGAGAVGATTQRVTLASDDPAVVALQTLDNAISGDEMQVDVLTQPARAAATDTITAKLATDAIQDGTTALTPKFAAIDAASSGDNTLVVAVASKKIRVLSAFLVAAGAVNVRFESGAGGTALTGQMNLTTNSGFCLPFNPVGWFETGSNTLLNLELSGAVSVDGCLTYVEV